MRCTVMRGSVGTLASLTPAQVSAIAKADAHWNLGGTATVFLLLFGGGAVVVPLGTNGSLVVEPDGHTHM